MKTDSFEVVRPFRNNKAEIAIYSRLHPDKRAQLAIRLLESWGMVAAIDTADEDRAGRMKLRLLAPDEVVSRACEVAENAYEAFQDRGWLMELPSPAEAAQQLEMESEKEEE
jgi:hypothetical protein